jgi:hypothetical protein
MTAGTPNSRLAAGDDGVEDRLRVGDRSADDAQDLADGGLPLERFLWSR